jgi:hypothetical protein
MGKENFFYDQRCKGESLIEAQLYLLEEVDRVGSPEGECPQIEWGLYYILPSELLAGARLISPLK